MLINRREMARKAGISYHLLRHYERNMVNVLELSRGSNKQVLFDEKDQAKVCHAVMLKKEKGYSMKQIFQYFNGSSNIEDECGNEDKDDCSWVDDVSDGSEHDDRNNCADHAEHVCDEEQEPAKATARGADNSSLFDEGPRGADSSSLSDEGPRGADSSSSEESPRALSRNVFAKDVQVLEDEVSGEEKNTARTDLAIISKQLQEFNRSSRELAQRVEQVNSKDFFNELAYRIEEGLERGLSSRFEAVQQGMLAQSEKTREIEQRNESLEYSCQRMSRKLEVLEQRLKRQEEKPSWGKRFWRWFFGVKEGEKKRTEKPSEAAEVAQGFVEHFKRFRSSEGDAAKQQLWYLESMGPATSSKGK